MLLGDCPLQRIEGFMVIIRIEWTISPSRTNFNKCVFPQTNVGQHIVDDHTIRLFKKVGPSPFLLLSVSKKEKESLGQWFQFKV